MPEYTPNVNDYQAHSIREQLEQRRAARTELERFPGKPADGEARSEWMKFQGVIRTSGENVRLLMKVTFNPQHQPFAHWFALLSKDPLAPTTRNVKRNLNVVWGTLAFGLFAYDFKWPPKIEVLGLEVYPTIGLLWAILGLLAYHVIYFSYYLLADARDWLAARRELLTLLDMSRDALKGIEQETDLADAAWLTAGRRALSQARWLFRSAYIRFVLDFTVPLVLALITGAALLSIGLPPKPPMCPCPGSTSP